MKSGLSHNSAFTLIEVSVWLFVTIFLLIPVFQASLYYITTAQRITAHTQTLVELQTACQLMHNDLTQAPSQLAAFTLKDMHTFAYKNSAGDTITWHFSTANQQLSREFTHQTPDGILHRDKSIVLEHLTDCTFKPIISNQRVREMVVTLTKAPHAIQRHFFINPEAIA